MTCPEEAADPDLIPSSPVPCLVQSCIVKTSMSCSQSPPLQDPSRATSDHQAQPFSRQPQNPQDASLHSTAAGLCSPACLPGAT